jgi:hypothetical protein
MVQETRGFDGRRHFVDHDGGRHATRDAAQQREWDLADRFRDSLASPSPMRGGAPGTPSGSGVPGVFTMLTISGLAVYLAFAVLPAGLLSFWWKMAAGAAVSFIAFAIVIRTAWLRRFCIYGDVLLVIACFAGAYAWYTGRLGFLGFG